MKKIAIIVLSLVVLMAGTTFNRMANPRDSCTIFTVQDDNQVYFASNEDWHESELFLGFSKATASSYGAMRIGYLVDGNVNFQSAINSAGLAWAVNSVPKARLNYETEMTYDLKTDNFFAMLINETATVTEAIELARQFDFGDEMSFQIHLADKSGNAVVISPDGTGKLGFTTKEAKTGYLISTNFNRSNPDSGIHDGRYETVAQQLESRYSGEPLSYLSGIIEAVSIHSLTTYTMISSVTNLVSGESVFYYMSQFDEAATFNFYEEMDRGDRIVSMREFYSEATVDAGDQAYRSFERRFFLAIGAVIVTGVLATGAIVILIVRRLKKRARNQRKDGMTNG